LNTAARLEARVVLRAGLQFLSRPRRFLPSVHTAATEERLGTLLRRLSASLFDRPIG
jgi:hypothetical protein